MDEAYRITFVQDESGFQVAGVQRLEMRVPAGQATDPASPRMGHFVELRGMEGEALYQRSFAPPAFRGIEYPDAEGQMRWAQGATSKTFSVLVPATDSARSVALVQQALASSLWGPPRIRRRDLVEIDLADFAGGADGRL
jgi:hypothetical protein